MEKEDQKEDRMYAGRRGGDGRRRVSDKGDSQGLVATVGKREGRVSVYVHYQV